MGINAADIMKQLFDTAEAVRQQKIDPEEALAVSALAGRQVEVMRTVIDYAKQMDDKTLKESAADVFLGTPNPRLLEDR